MDQPPQHSEPFVSVVVLTWNDTKMTRKCLAHIFASTYSNFNVILVDNGSREPCGRELAAEFPKVELIELPHNLGFAGGGNVGLKRALELNPKYVCHLNNDAFVSQDAIALLVEAMEARPKCGIAHPMLLYPDEDRVQFYTATVDRDMARHIHHHVGDRLSTGSWPTVESEFVPACAIVYRADALKSVGIYDEKFGTSWEDYDIILRFRDAGWQVIVVGDARVDHRSHQTTGTVSPYIIYHSTRNRLICIQRYARRSELLKRAPTLARSFYWDLKHHGLTNWTGHKSFILGAWDFLRGNVGEKSRFYVAPPGSADKPKPR